MRGIETAQDRNQARITTGLKVASGKDNAAYFAISETLKGDSGMNKALKESLTLTRNAISVGRLATQSILEMTGELGEKLMLAQSQYDMDPDFDGTTIQADIDAILKRISGTVAQASFNGTSFVDGHGNQHWDSTDGLATGLNPDTSRWTSSRDYDIRADQDDAGYDPALDPDVVQVAVGVSRKGGDIEVSSLPIKKADLLSIEEELQWLDVTKDFQLDKVAIKGGKVFRAGDDRIAFYIDLVEQARGMLIEEAASLGQAEKSIERQQSFLTELTDIQDAGVGRLVDADMEEEAARMQALQVQQQLASQSLSIANQAPQNILSLFR
ncbi:flagellin [Limimaricola soesokkakensis]|uniref:Flagellin n=2 Tax=Limimaricola soesokkakensis TaxID=1343159 RepID=A0A1X7A8U0_9RHOB|nr:flagellin [Limimaricola soesokkakensis]SLN73061.1 Flagellin [Limimaricola soesokkakensis]